VGLKDAVYDVIFLKYFACEVACRKELSCSMRKFHSCCLCVLCLIASELSRFFSELSCCLMVDLEKMSARWRASGTGTEPAVPFHAKARKARQLWFRAVSIHRRILQHWTMIDKAAEFEAEIDQFVLDVQRMYPVRGRI